LKFEITTKKEDGTVAGNFTLNQAEASFVLNIGLNYLAVNGALPLFTGKEDNELGVVAPSTGTMQ
jgi:hypothetical protein